MTWGEFTWGEASWGGDGVPQWTPDPFKQLIRDPRALLTFAAIATPLNPSGPDETLRVASRTFQTDGSDTPANTTLEPRLLDPAYGFQSEIPLPVGRRGGRGRASVGSVAFANDDRAFDAWLERSWEGQEIEVRAGGTYAPGRPEENVLPFEHWGLISRGVVESVVANRQTIELVMRPFLAQLRTPFQTESYSGDFDADTNPGSIEGDETIKGQTKPVGLGICTNVPAVLVNPLILILQWSDKGSRALLAARDNGVTLTSGGDESLANITDPAYTFAPGVDYVTHLAKSLIRLNDAPEGLVTTDFEGDDDVGYVESTPDLIKRVCTTRGGPFTSEQIDSGGFQSFPHKGRVGFWLGLGEQRTCEEIALLLAEAADGWITASRQGLVRMGTWPNPSTGLPTRSYPASRISEADEAGQAQPVFRVRAGFRKRWAVQSEDSLGAISQELKKLYSSERTFIDPQEDLTVLADNTLAEESVLETFFHDESDAVAVAAAKLARDKIRRRQVRALTHLTTFEQELGSLVEIDIDQQGLETAKTFVVVGISERGEDRSLELGLWG